jgi:glycerol-3-phosphate acyltransferase PlsY
MVIDIALIITAYLMGSLSSAIIVCKLFRLPDPRSQGSGNPGATNVLRFGGKKMAIIVLLGDVLKGLIPVLIAKAITDEEAILAGVTFAAFIGHLYPVFFGFKGGKGVATAFGVLLGLSWPVALSILGIWLGMTMVFRYSSLSALTAAILAPVMMHVFEASQIYTSMAIILSLLLVWRHHSNIRNLLTGKESKIGAKS